MIIKALLNRDNKYITLVQKTYHISQIYLKRILIYIILK